MIICRKGAKDAEKFRVKGKNVQYRLADTHLVLCVLTIIHLITALVFFASFAPLRQIVI